MVITIINNGNENLRTVVPLKNKIIIITVIILILIMVIKICVRWCLSKIKILIFIFILIMVINICVRWCLRYSLWCLKTRLQLGCRHLNWGVPSAMVHCKTEGKKKVRHAYTSVRFNDPFARYGTRVQV